MRRAEKGRGAAKAVLLKWLKEGEWRREEGIVEFIAILRWPHTHEACIQTERIKLASFREKLPVQVRLHKMCTP